MKKSSSKNVAASVHQRLLNVARETGRPFNEVLQYFAMERVLYRLSCSGHKDSFVLKGALLSGSYLYNQKLIIEQQGALRST